MKQNQIIMSFNLPPSAEDIEAMAQAILSGLPDELARLCETLSLAVEEFPDDATQQDLELEDPYELLAFYRNGSQIAPGVTKKTANDDDVLVLYRRPLLDAWCETGDDLSRLLMQVIVGEIAQNFDFSETDIEEMTERHMLVVG